MSLFLIVCKKKDKIESAHLALTSQKKKRKRAKDSNTITKKAFVNI